MLGPLGEQRPQGAGQATEAQVRHRVDVGGQQRLDDRPQRVRLAKGRTDRRQCGMVGAGRGRQELVQESALADAGLPLDQHQRRGVGEDLPQPGQFFVAADQQRRRHLTDVRVRRAGVGRDPADHRRPLQLARADLQAVNDHRLCGGQRQAMSCPRSTGLGLVDRRGWVRMTTCRVVSPPSPSTPSNRA